MLMHGENSSLQDNSAQQRTDPVLPGIGISPTASQTVAPSHQCCKYLAKTCQGCQHALSLPAKAGAKTATTHLPTSHTHLPISHTHLTRSGRDITPLSRPNS